MRVLVVGLVAVVPLLLAGLVDAEPVYVCEQSPGGPLSVTAFASNTDAERQQEVARLHRHGILPAPAQCWFLDAARLPASTRPDPRRPADELSQYHRWRRSGDRVVVDETVKRPHPLAIQRESEAMFGHARRAAVLATPLGDNLFRALRLGEWDLVKALLGQIRLRVGRPDEVMTVAEVQEIERIGDDYEADFR